MVAITWPMCCIYVVRSVSLIELYSALRDICVGVSTRPRASERVRQAVHSPHAYSCTCVFRGHQRCRAMGKNSNVHKSQAYINQDLLKEKEAEEKKALRRARAEQKLAEQTGEMAVEGAASVDVQAKKKKTFGKVKTSTIKKMKIGKHERPLQKGVKKGGGLSIKPALNIKKSKIRKPSSLMKKTLRKIAKQQDGMVL